MSESSESDRANDEGDFFTFEAKGKLGDNSLIAAVIHFFCGS